MLTNLYAVLTGHRTLMNMAVSQLAMLSNTLHTYIPAYFFIHKPVTPTLERGLTVANNNLFQSPRCNTNPLSALNAIFCITRSNWLTAATPKHFLFEQCLKVKTFPEEHQKNVVPPTALGRTVITKNMTRSIEGISIQLIKNKRR